MPLRQRFYDPSIGRFTRRDTYEGRLAEPITLNKYLYTHSNPVNYTDPTGYFTMGEKIAIGVLVGTLAALVVTNFVTGLGGDPIITRRFNETLATWIPMASKKSFDSPEAAALYVLKKENPHSIRRNIEFGGLIVEKDNKYYYTGPFKGSQASVRTGNPPRGYTAVADYHTHGDTRDTFFDRVRGINRAYGSNAFSEGDKIDTDQKGIPGYLATPEGSIWVYHPGNRNKLHLPPEIREGEMIRDPGYAL